MSPHDETQVPQVPQEVEVDQRALVNILARYPGQFDVLRELIQNADDAEAPSVEVHFQTDEGKESRSAGEVKGINKINVRKWIIKNKGSLEEQDWERLGRIAAGNDDSTKVGAFGVGFYSVLSKSDRPLVRSNGKSLQFCRGEDGKLRKWIAHCSPDTWTSVELELRVPEPLPALADLTRFLVSSVALLTNIHIISIYLDSQRLLHIQKESCGSPVDIPIPPHLKRTTLSQTLTVESIQRTVQKITIDAAEWAFTSCSTRASLPPIDDTADTLVERSGRCVEDYPTPTSSAEAMLQENAITHDLYTAATSVNLPPESEMKRGVESCLKSLPSSFRCKGVYFNSDQYDSFTRIDNSSKHLACLFSGSQGIVPQNNKQVPLVHCLTYIDTSLSELNSGRLFIGQSTNQTTGIGLHISAHFLPTMERGSIDLANGQIAAWNNEVLWVGGLLARIIYEEEMRIANSKDDATRLGLCTMGRFTFGSTAPHSGVSQILQEAFFSCCHKESSSTSPFPVVSDVGISCASDSQFRQSNNSLSFLKRYRILHGSIEPRQHSEIIKRYEIPLFKYTDIVREFATGVTQDTMKSFFVWWQDTRRNSLSSEAKAAGEKFCQKFASQGVLRLSNGVKIALKNIKHFTFFPLPDDLSPPDNIYVDITLGVPTRDAVECFGWAQLSLLEWLEYACTQARQLAPNGDPDVGRRILHVLVQFALVEDPNWDQVADLIKDTECIPTNMGLKLPADSYFDEADLCRCLPVAKEGDFLDVPVTYVADAGGFQPRTVNQEHVRKVLKGLRVRPTMEWKDLVERLETAASEESNDRLLQFLAAHREFMSQHINDLKTRKVFHSQNHGRMSVIELHLPNEDIRKLGLPILALPRNSVTSLLLGSVDPSISSAMAQFIESLGIQRYPTLHKIIERAASDDPEAQRSALQYFLSNLDTRYDTYKPEDFTNVPFIPTKSGSRARLNEVFASPVWERLGFKQASEALRPRDLLKLGVKDHPSIDMIIEYFKTPTRTLPDLKTAITWFENLYVHGKLPVLELREQLSAIPFVPVESPGPSPSEPPTIKYFPPKECFIGSSDSKEHHRNIFPFVDFGQKGNNFLESCCAKQSPDASDIVREILKGPQRYLKALRDDTKLYLDDLRTIASRFDSISDDDKNAMEGAPMFLAFQQRKDRGKLLPAHQVVISDWESREWESHGFGGNVYLAPKEDIIEKMYHKKGSRFFGTYVHYDIRPSGLIDNYHPPLNRDQFIRRIRCFMSRRDKSEKAEVSFYEEGLKDNFRMRGCKTLIVKKTFAPPYGVLADGVDASRETTVKAGFESGELSTLWVAKYSSESIDLLRNDIAVALCRVLLKSFGPNDVLLLTSLIAMDDKRLDDYYDDEAKPEPSPSAAKAEPKKKVKVELRVPSHLVGAVMLFGLRPKGLRSSPQQTMSPEEDVQNAIARCRDSDSDNQSPDFSAPCQPHRTNFKKPNSNCKEAHRIRLKEKSDLQDGEIKFFLAQHARCQHPPQAPLQKFAKLISSLAGVFDLEASKACFIFWKDTDEELMAFNRDQKYIFFNLAHYYKFFYNEGDETKVVNAWFLIMAHEIAHNVTLDHDEYHGSLSSRLVLKYLPALRKHFECFGGDAPLQRST